MKLLTKAILKKLPKLGAMGGHNGLQSTEPMAIVKFFNPCGYATWFASEFDGEDTFFGWAILHPGCGEYGYFSLSELQSIKLRFGPFGLGIERDMHFTPCLMSEAIKRYE